MFLRLVLTRHCLMHHFESSAAADARFRTADVRIASQSGLAEGHLSARIVLARKRVIVISSGRFARIRISSSTTDYLESLIPSACVSPRRYRAPRYERPLRSSQSIPGTVRCPPTPGAPPHWVVYNIRPSARSLTIFEWGLERSIFSESEVVHGVRSPSP